MSKKRANANEGRVVATVKSIYVVNKTSIDNSVSEQTTLNLSNEPDEFTKEVFTGALARASRRTCAPASETSET